MAEFGEVMRQWKRMCGGTIACEECPLRQAEIEGTSVCDSGIMSFDYKGAEPIIMSWAAEHPGPVYPTWAEWLAENGAFGPFKDIKTDFTEVEILCKMRDMMFKPIPADVAEKLGIQPKEAT